MMLAGRIIPAIATTTATITGFIQLELYKYVKGADLSDFRAATVNLAHAHTSLSHTHTYTQTYTHTKHANTHTNARAHTPTHPRTRVAKCI